jgi:hypothetical protein
MLEYVALLSRHYGMVCLRVKWKYDERTCYNAICPNTGWELTIERVPIRQLHCEWEMWIDNGSERVSAGATTRKLTDAQRRFEIWIGDGSQPQLIGWI